MSAVSVIATSSGAASAYVRDGLTNLKVGMFLEMFTIAGALLGASITLAASTRPLFVVFGLVLLTSWGAMLARPRETWERAVEQDAPSRRLRHGDLIGGILITGLCASLGCIMAGLAWYRSVHGSFDLDYQLPATGLGPFLVADTRVVTSLHAGPRRLVNLGIGILLLTPYVRVVASLAYFLVARNWKYSFFTATVLAMLTSALFR